MHCRRAAARPSCPIPTRPGTTPGETVLLDENALAEGHDYFALGDLRRQPGPDRRLAYSTDYDRRRALRRCASATSRPATDLDDVVPDVYYGARVGERRPHRLLHPARRRDAAVAGLAPHARAPTRTHDVLVFQEDDERFFVGVDRTRTGRVRAHHVGVEGDHRGAARRRRRRRRLQPRVVEPRAAGRRVRRRAPRRSLTDGRPVLRRHQRRRRRELRADGRAGRIDPGARHWTRGRRRTGPTCGSTTSTRSPTTSSLSERADGLEQLRVLRLGRRRRARRSTHAREPVYTLGRRTEPRVRDRRRCASGTRRWSRRRRRTTTTSTPRARRSSSGSRCSAATTRRATRRSGCGRRRPTARGCRSRSCTARDVGAATATPLLALRLRLLRDSIDPTFSSVRLQPARPRRRVRHRPRPRRRRAGPPLVRRRQARCTSATRSPTSSPAPSTSSPRAGRRPSRLAARGGSAGGLLMGAVMNLRPDLFRAVVAEVPFVDALTTMLDATLPAHRHRVGGVGQPGRRSARSTRYMKSYSPYDNVAATRLSGDARHRRAERPAGAVLGAGQVGRQAAGRRRPTTVSSCSRPRWAPATAVRRVATTRGATRRWCWRSSSTSSGSGR